VPYAMPQGGQAGQAGQAQVPYAMPQGGQQPQFPYPFPYNPHMSAYGMMPPGYYPYPGQYAQAQAQVPVAAPVAALAAGLASGRRASESVVPAKTAVAVDPPQRPVGSCIAAFPPRAEKPAAPQSGDGLAVPARTQHPLVSPVRARPPPATDADGRDGPSPFLAGDSSAAPQSAGLTVPAGRAHPLVSPARGRPSPADGPNTATIPANQPPPVERPPNHLLATLQHIRQSVDSGETELLPAVPGVPSLATSPFAYAQSQLASVATPLAAPPSPGMDSEAEEAYPVSEEDEPEPADGVEPESAADALPADALPADALPADAPPPAVPAAASLTPASTPAALAARNKKRLTASRPPSIFFAKPRDGSIVVSRAKGVKAGDPPPMHPLYNCVPATAPTASDFAALRSAIQDAGDPTTAVLPQPQGPAIGSARAARKPSLPCTSQNTAFVQARPSVLATMPAGAFTAMKAEWGDAVPGAAAAGAAAAPETTGSQPTSRALKTVTSLRSTVGPDSSVLATLPDMMVSAAEKAVNRKSVPVLIPLSHSNMGDNEDGLVRVANQSDKHLGIEVTLHQTTLQGGETLKGFVLVSFKTMVNTKGLFLKIEGADCAHWTSGIDMYRCKKPFFEEVIPLKVPCEKKKTLEFAPGVYKFSFSYTLPKTLAFSFKKGTQIEFKRGVSYRVKGYLVSESGKKVAKNFHSFTVCGEYEWSLVDVPTIVFRSKMHNFKTTKGQMNLSAYLNNGYFEVGDTMEIKVIFENRSSRACSGMAISVVETGVQRLRGKKLTMESEKKWTESLFTNQTTECAAVKNSSFTKVWTYLVDGTWPTRHTPNNVIEIEHFVRVILAVPMHGDIKVELPFTVFPRRQTKPLPRKQRR